MHEPSGTRRNQIKPFFSEKKIKNRCFVHHEVDLRSTLPLPYPPQVGEFRAHAAEWTANVSAEFKETRRRLSVDVYDKFQRAASIKRKLSSELGLNVPPRQDPMGRRTLSVNLGDEREAYPSLALCLTPVPGALSRNGSLYLNGLSPDYADRKEIEIAILETPN